MVDTVRVYQIGGEVLYEPPQHVQLQQTCAIVLYETTIGAARVRVGQAAATVLYETAPPTLNRPRQMTVLKL